VTLFSHRRREKTPRRPFRDENVPTAKRPLSFCGSKAHVLFAQAEFEIAQFRLGKRKFSKNEDGRKFHLFFVPFVSEFCRK